MYYPFLEREASRFPQFDFHSSPLSILFNSLDVHGTVGRRLVMSSIKALRGGSLVFLNSL